MDETYLFKNLSKIRFYVQIRSRYYVDLRPPLL